MMTPSGVTLYFSHSTAHCSCPIGGRIPLTGSHSVMDRPDSVRRVTPPTTMMKKTNPDEMYSQLATTGVVSPGRDPADDPAAGSTVAAETAAESRAMFFAFADELMERRNSVNDDSSVPLFRLPKIPALRAVLMRLLERADRRKS